REIGRTVAYFPVQRLSLPARTPAITGQRSPIQTREGVILSYINWRYKCSGQSSPGRPSSDSRRPPKFAWGRIVTCCWRMAEAVRAGQFGDCRVHLDNLRYLHARALADVLRGYQANAGGEGVVGNGGGGGVA